MWYKHQHWLVLLFAKVDVFRSSNVPSPDWFCFILFFYRKHRGIVILKFISSTARCHFFRTDLVNDEVFSVQHLSGMWWRHLFLWPQWEHSLSPKSLYVNIGMHTDCDMVQAVNHRTFMAEAGIRLGAIACEIYGGHSGTAIGVSLNTSGISLSLACQQCSMFIFIYMWHLSG